MAFRGGGRGRGRGRGGMGGGFAKQEPFILFPEDVVLPDVNGVALEDELEIVHRRLQRYWINSPYYLEETAPTKREDVEIERYSDRSKSKSQAKRDPLSYHLKLTTANFPQELIQGSRRLQHDQRKVRWNPESGLHKLDVLEKLEEKYGDKDDKPKKEGENEEEDEEGIEVEDEEFSDDGDYNQNIEFDDDEDDFNMEEGNDDEVTY